MGAARLLAKVWVVFCLFAGAHAVHLTIVAGGDTVSRLVLVVLCALIFIAMGLLFVGGYAASGGRLAYAPRVRDLSPAFDDWVFIGFVALSFLNQILFAPDHVSTGVALALENFVRVIVPGQLAFEGARVPCGLGWGGLFTSSFAWLLAIVYLASASSRLKLKAGLLRLERVRRPEVLGPTVLAALFTVIAIAGIQLLYVGAAYRWLPCSAFAGISGAALAGLAPLVLAYVVATALATILASGEERAK